MCMGTAQHFRVQHSRQTNIGTVASTPCHFIHSVMTNRTRANDFELMLWLCFHVLPPITKKWGRTRSALPRDSTNCRCSSSGNGGNKMDLTIGWDRLGQPAGDDFTI